MSKEMILGIDTSNYMTSICFIDMNRNIIYEARKLLEVNEGETGLQQSKAVFQHLKNLPILFSEAKNHIDSKWLKIISVSDAPRPVENSYMPVFVVGKSFAESLSIMLKVPVVFTTHQEGHISAGIYSSLFQSSTKEFIAIHISGGTSEILHIKNHNSSYQIEKIGGTLDLHAGQLIDRIGVRLGLPFPAGKYLEDLARQSKEDFNRIPSSVRAFEFHFSGAEAAAKRRIDEGESPSNIARAVEHVIAVSIKKALLNTFKKGLPRKIIVVGGVAQNEYIKTHLENELYPEGAELFFAEKKYSGDNAFGVANIGLNHYLNIQSKDV